MKPKLDAIEMQPKESPDPKSQTKLPRAQMEQKLPPRPEFIQRDMQTLEESVVESLYRDVKQILIRVRYVILPFGRTSNKLKQWDLWGPLVLCLCLAWTLSAGAAPTAANQIFGTVFCLVWLGAIVVTLNAKLLKGRISFFHCVCTLGYSLFPMNIAAFIGVFLKNYITFGMAAIITAICFLWSFKAASMYMDKLVRKNSKGLSLYPVFLFYIFLGFFTLEMSH